MVKIKKSKGYVIGCIALSVLMALSTYFSLVVFGVLAEDKKLYGATEQNQVPETVYVDPQQVVDNNVIVNDATQSVVGGNASQNVGSNTQSGVSGNVQSQQVQNSVGNNNQGASQGTQISNPLLSTNKTKADIVKIYADVMNNAKAKKPGFKKVEYQELPGDPANRVVSEGGEHATDDAINKLLGVIEGLGVFVSKEDAYAEPYIHEKGDADMSLFPVFSREKGSYLTDPNGIDSFTYELLANGNVKMGFTLVSEDNPEPVGENSDVAPSYTGAVFSPMSKARIDRTINHPVISVFATEVEYSLRYHDCYVEVEFNPQTLEIKNLTQIAKVSIKGSGNVVMVGRVGVARQELFSTVLITDLTY